MRRAVALGAAGVAVAALVGCNYRDKDFTTRCAGVQSFRVIDAAGTHEVVVTVPSSWIDEAVAASSDVVKTIDLPSDGVDVAFNVGHDLDEIDLHYCLDFGDPPSPAVDETLTDTAGNAEIVLHPASYWRDVTADLTLDHVVLSDGETKIVTLSMEDATIGRAP
jgi:hypothetical protein